MSDCQRVHCTLPPQKNNVFLMIFPLKIQVFAWAQAPFILCRLNPAPLVQQVVQAVHYEH